MSLSFGEWEKIKREQKGISLRKAASIIGISAGNLSRLENNRIESGLGVVVRAASVLGYSYRTAAPDLGFAIWTIPTGLKKISGMLTWSELELWLSQQFDLDALKIPDLFPLSREGMIRIFTGSFEEAKALLKVVYPSYEIMAEDFAFIIQPDTIIIQDDLLAFLRLVKERADSDNLQQQEVKARIAQIERGEVDQIPLSGLTQLDASLGTGGMLFEMAWRSVEFESGFDLMGQGKNSIDSAAPGWEEQQYRKAVFVVALSRLQLIRNR